jgi:hypothetical protein
MSKFPSSTKAGGGLPNFGEGLEEVFEDEASSHEDEKEADQSYEQAKQKMNQLNRNGGPTRAIFSAKARQN